jgi:hypothetical protein
VVPVRPRRGARVGGRLAPAVQEDAVLDLGHHLVGGVDLGAAPSRSRREGRDGTRPARARDRRLEVLAVRGEEELHLRERSERKI